MNADFCQAIKGLATSKTGAVGYMASHGHMGKKGSPPPHGVKGLTRKPSLVL